MLFSRKSPGAGFMEDGFGQLRSLSPRARAAVLAVFHGLQVANKFLLQEVESPRLEPEVMQLAFDLHELQNKVGSAQAGDSEISVLMQLLVTRLADSTGSFLEKDPRGRGWSIHGPRRRGCTALLWSLCTALVDEDAISWAMCGSSYVIPNNVLELEKV